ncbi:MAG TPA: hypothetical protein PLY04_02340 [bacterium]|nr:hypothetical protein [bacterium]
MALLLQKLELMLPPFVIPVIFLALYRDYFYFLFSIPFKKGADRFINLRTVQPCFAGQPCAKGWFWLRNLTSEKGGMLERVTGFISSPSECANPTDKWPATYFAALLFSSHAYCFSIF